MDLKRTINLNKKFILIMLFIVGIVLLLSYSYAFYQLSFIKNNVVVLKSSNDFTITTTIDDTNSDTFTLPASGSKTVVVHLTTNEITSAMAYKMYYELTGTGSFTITSEETFTDNKIEGVLQPIDKTGYDYKITGKNITLTFTNNSSNALTIKLGAIGGFEKTGATLANNQDELFVNIKMPVDLTFNGTTINRTYGDATSDTTITGATDGSGNYTYTEKSETKSGTPTNYISISGTTITVQNTIPAGTYTYVVTATDTTLGIEKDATFTISVAKKATTMSISPASGTINCGGSTTLTVTTDGDGTISCTPSNTTKASCSVSGTTVTINGLSGQDGSVSLTISQAAGTNYNAATNQTYNLTINACASWHYSRNYFIASACAKSNGCPDYCQENYSISVWSCITSLTTPPASASLESGKYCWCKY